MQFHNFCKKIKRKEKKRKENRIEQIIKLKPILLPDFRKPDCRL